MLTGQIPFGGSSLVETLQKQVTEPLPDPRQFNEALSDGLRRASGDHAGEEAAGAARELGSTDQ